MGFFALLSFLLVSSAAGASTVEQAAVVAGQESIQAQPGCQGTGLPPDRYIRVKDGLYFSNPQRSACDQCDDAAWTWAHQGYGTWCWETSATTAELWIGPVFATGKPAAIERASVKYSAQDENQRDPWYIFDHYATQQACEADRATGVSKQLWTWERSACATNEIEWVLLIDYGQLASANKGAAAALTTAV